MQKQKSLKTNSVLNILKTVSAIIFPLITFPYVSRVLQPENIGKVNFSGTYVGYFSLIASLGVATYAVRECAAVRDNRKNLSLVASEIFSINVCTTVIAYILLAISLILFRQLDNYRTLIYIQSSTILFATWGADWLNSAMEDFKYITIRSIFFQCVSLILTFALIKSPDDYLNYAVISVLSSSGANLSNVFYRRKYCELRFTLNMQVQKHLKPILLLFVMILAQTVFNSADITMLGLSCGDTEVGIYSTAYRIKSIIVQVVSSLAVVMMPRMSYYFAEDDWDKINRMLKKVLSVMVTIGFPCIAGCVSLSDDIVRLVGGTEYADASIPLKILMLSFIIDIFGGNFLGNMICIPIKQEKVFMEACCVAAGVNVILNYLLIPIVGATAAAFTSGIAALVILIWLLLKKDKRVRIDYILDVIKMPVIGAIAIVLFCSITKVFKFGFWISLIIKIGGSVVLYGVIQLIAHNPVVVDMLNLILKKMERKGDSK